MVPLAVSVGVHLTLAGVLLVIVPAGVASVTSRAPVRITYFMQPLTLPDVPGLDLTLPAADVDPSSLPGRPITAEAGSAAVGSGPVGGTSGSPNGGTSGLESRGGQAPTPEPEVETAPPTPAAVETPVKAPVAVVAPPEKVAALKEEPATGPETPEPPPEPEVKPGKPVEPAEEKVALVEPAHRPGHVVDIGPGMPRAEITKKVVPKYPSIARSQRVRGIVQVQVVIDTQGRVSEAKVVASPSPLLNREAVEAAKKMRFRPYEWNGQVVSVRTRIPFKFDFKR